MTPLEREKLRALCDAATPGPWKARHRAFGLTAEDDECSGLGLVVDGPPEAWNRGQYARGADARFIAAAREALPRLLDELERVEGK